MRLNNLRLFTAVIASTLCAFAHAETVTCPVTRDAWISAYKAKRGKADERDDNMGAAPKIKLKYWQEFGLVDFDVSALKGKSIKEAWLYLKPVGKTVLGLKKLTDLRWLCVSSVAHDWVEGKSTDYARDTVGHGATFNESSYQKADWGWPGSKLWDVVVGNGNSLRFDGLVDAAPDKKGWVRCKLDPRLVRALVAGATHGFFLMEGNASWHVSIWIGTREGKAGPFLKVVTEGDDATPPAKPTGLRAEAAIHKATATHGALRVSLTVPDGAFAYRARVNGRDLERWQLPFPAAAGSPQTFEVLDLPSAGDCKLEIAAVDAAGNASPFAAVETKASPKLSVPTLPAYGFQPKAGEPRKLGEAKVWALPEITKVDPVTAKVMHEKGADDFDKRNPVWDGANGTVRLAAAMGEIVSFQLAVQGKASGCGVKVSALKGAGDIPNSGVRLYRNWFVEKHAEYALPLKGTFDCPSADNNITGQTIQTVTVDYHIPKDTKPGDYDGTVTVSSGDAKAELKLKVKVYNVTMPDDVHFNPELNCYKGPGTAGSAKFKDSFRLAHYHRCTINRVPYSQTGRTHDDWIPQIDGAGRVTDWSKFDNNLAGLLTGEWFKDNPRAGVPVATFYLPFYEGWPKNFRDHYKPGEGVPVHTVAEFREVPKKEQWKVVDRHVYLAKPIDQAVDQGYKDAFIACVKDFVAHAKERGWTRTLFQSYLNNKAGYGYTFWTLDEPNVYLDWRTINFYGELWKEGVQDPAVYTRAFHRELYTKGLRGMKRDRPTFLYRGDISRPWWQGSLSNKIMNIMYSNNSLFGTHRMMLNHRDRMPTILYAYGSANKVGDNNWQSAAWCVKAFAHGRDGVLPWQSLGGASALTKPTQTSLIIDAGKYGHAVASLRVHAMRRGAQDAELLRLLQLKNNWNRDQIGMLVAQRVPLSSSFKQSFVDAASELAFGQLSSRGFCELKEGVLKLLEGK